MSFVVTFCATFLTGLTNCNSLLETAMGSKVNAQSNPSNKYVDAVHSAGVKVFERMVKPQHFYQFIYSMSTEGRQYKQSLKVLHNFTKDVSDY